MRPTSQIRETREIETFASFCADQRARVANVIGRVSDAQRLRRAPTLSALYLAIEADQHIARHAGCHATGPKKGNSD